MDNSLTISEKFYSIQGEGQTMGTPAIFVRLAGCNLLCKSSSWVCDSIEVWKKGTKTMFEDVLDEEEQKRLERRRTHLVFTGGEPMLYQKKIIAYLNYFISEYGFKPIVEIETNGTIRPLPEMFHWVNYWNVSPKLSNSGESLQRRFNKKAIEEISYTVENLMFKFVVSSEADLDEIRDFFIRLVGKSNIYLMPAGETREQLEKIRLKVIELCLRYEVKYSERLHIVAWNKKTGV